MANYVVDWNTCKEEVYYYYTGLGGQPIPMLITTLPITWEELSVYNQINYIANTNQGYISGETLKISDIKWPFWWQRIKDSGVYIYKDTYKDKYISFTTESNGQSKIDILNSTSGASTGTYRQLGTTLNIDYIATFYIWLVKTTDNIYISNNYPTTGGDSSLQIFYTYDMSYLLSNVSQGSKKGRLKPSNDFLYAYNSIIQKLETVDYQCFLTYMNMLGISILQDSEDPYLPGGDQPDPDDGGDGDFDYTPDPIDIPDLPTVTATSSGLVTLYAPTSDQLKALADYLWSDAFSLESFKKLFNNPIDAILGLYLIPVNVGTGTAKEITVGNLVSTVSCNTVTTQYVSVDCGTFTFSKSAFTNSFLDWSPYTKCYLYLPFIGTQEINIDEFMGTTMHVVYHVDVMTGAMMCYVSNSTDGVIYEYMGQCSENIPLSSTSYSNTIGSILNAAAAVGGVVATAVTGGAAAPAALGMLGGASTATAQAASSLKPSVAHSGNIGGGAGIMSVNYPYLIFITPRTDIPSSQYKYVGTPSNKVVKLSSLSGTGFNQIEAINLSVKGATDTECTEIDATLKAGVIL